MWRLLPSLISLWAVTSLAGPRLDQIQILGTHNSYHLAPHPSLDALIRAQSPEQADALAYSHRPLPEQFQRLGIRQIELDIYADPQGGLFAKPAGIDRAADLGLPYIHPPDPQPLLIPGSKILHVPDVDFQTTVPTLTEALRQVMAWSDSHPQHVPLFLLLELKHKPVSPELTQPIPWTAALLDALEREILTILPSHRILRPDDLRGPHRSLREAVVDQGWPSLAETRGKCILLLDNTDALRDLYLAPSPTLAHRLAFVSVDEDHPAAAWFKINDPHSEFDRIQRLVQRGFLVRTRADAETRQARLNDPARRDAAFASGAQLISTDYPEPHLSWSPYHARWQPPVVARPNPVSPPPLTSATPPHPDLEELAVPGLEPFHPRELDLLNQRAIRSHQQRRLADASRDYSRLLQLEPPRLPTDIELQHILRLAPLLLTHPDEPFALRDLVALHHPDLPRIAYHLFWEDDIDFPEDNDPADHEVVWVEYEPITGQPTRLWSYFHGPILEAPAREERPRFAIEWGKHGSLPVHDHLPVTLPTTLERHWRQLHHHGTRLPDHPLARRWPKQFPGDWTDFQRFTRTVDPLALLERRRLIWVSRWANAVLDQYALPYNFAPKIEWPD